jgi:mannose-6-phosphate isomerase
MRETPWGGWEVLSEAATHKVKRITVRPGRRLSYQRHARRGEHWFFVEGAGLLTLDGRETPVSAGACADIPAGAAHRVANTGSSDLVLIEVSTGEYFGEDDIVRLQDDYGRS